MKSLFKYFYKNFKSSRIWRKKKPFPKFETLEKVKEKLKTSLILQQFSNNRT